MMKRLKIGTDLDDVIFDFMNTYLSIFGPFKNDLEITRNVYSLRNNREFWTNLPVLNVPDFRPELFCTKRINSKAYTKAALKKIIDISNIPIYQIYMQKHPKSKQIKGKVDVFIDDSISNFLELNNAGVFCLLMDTPFNRHFETPLRIYSLKYEEISYIYNQIKYGR